MVIQNFTLCFFFVNSTGGENRFSFGNLSGLESNAVPTENRKCEFALMDDF